MLWISNAKTQLHFHKKKQKITKKTFYIISNHMWYTEIKPTKYVPNFSCKIISLAMCGGSWL